MLPVTRERRERAVNAVSDSVSDCWGTVGEWQQSAGELEVNTRVKELRSLGALSAFALCCAPQLDGSTKHHVQISTLRISTESERTRQMAMFFASRTCVLYAKSIAASL